VESGSDQGFSYPLICLTCLHLPLAHAPHSLFSRSLTALSDIYTRYFNIATVNIWHTHTAVTALLYSSSDCHMVIKSFQFEQKKPSFIYSPIEDRKTLNSCHKTDTLGGFGLDFHIFCCNFLTFQIPFVKSLYVGKISWSISPLK